jgi:hypothetical protein
LSKRKGTAWETRVADHLRLLHPRAERRTLSGNKDKGDIAGIDGWVIEAKNCASLSLAAWMDEAKKEALNAGVTRWAVVFPRRQKSTAEGYALIPLWLLSELALSEPLGDGLCRVCEGGTGSPCFTCEPS